MSKQIVKKCWKCRVRSCNKLRFGGVCKRCAENLNEERSQRTTKEIKSVWLSESQNRYRTYFN